MKYYVISCKQTFSESIHRSPVYRAEESQGIRLNITGEIMEAFFFFGTLTDLAGQMSC